MIFKSYSLSCKSLGLVRLNTSHPRRCLRAPRHTCRDHRTTRAADPCPADGRPGPRRAPRARSKRFTATDKCSSSISAGWRKRLKHKFLRSVKAGILPAWRDSLCRQSKGRAEEARAWSPSLVPVAVPGPPPALRCCCCLRRRQLHVVLCARSAATSTLAPGSCAAEPRHRQHRSRQGFVCGNYRTKQHPAPLKRKWGAHLCRNPQRQTLSNLRGTDTGRAFIRDMKRCIR